MDKATQPQLAIIMVALNEAHNMAAVLENIKGFASQIFLVDSYSSDATVDIALEHGVHVVQREFRGFGEQWNFALSMLPITAQWTMKLDPDERITEELKTSIRTALNSNNADAITFRRQLWFMGKPVYVRQDVLRVWRTGTCKFSDVLVNEHPLVRGVVTRVKGDLEHHDSPNLHHWWDKQNRYTTAEALSAFRGAKLSVQPRLFGDELQRRMWFKAHFWRIPFRHFLLFLHGLLIQGAWRAGRAGVTWARLRAEVYRMIELKHLELRRRGGGGIHHPTAACRPARPAGTSVSSGRSVTLVGHARERLLVPIPMCPPAELCSRLGKAAGEAA